MMTTAQDNISHTNNLQDAASCKPLNRPLSADPYLLPARNQLSQRKSLSAEDINTTIKNEIPLLNRVVDHNKLLEGATKVVLDLFPEWHKKDLTLVQCKDGITNKLVKVTHTDPNSRENVVLVRAYGKKSEVLIDRQQEIINIVTLSKLGLCPPLYGRFKNGLAYGYVHGQVCTPEDLTTEHVGRAIAKSLKTWHSVVQNESDTHDAKLFDTLERWLAEVPDHYSTDARTAQFKARFNNAALKDELCQLKAHLESVSSPVVFCHSDLLAANIIYNKEREEANFIDYEYGTWSFRGFDIGNHWNEWAGFECDYSRFPSKSRAIDWLRNYAGPGASENELERLYHEGCKFALASHFYWGLWALVQASVSDIDFDYMTYAVLRFDEYERRKAEFMAL